MSTAQKSVQVFEIDRAAPLEWLRTGQHKSYPAVLYESSKRCSKSSNCPVRFTGFLRSRMLHRRLLR